MEKKLARERGITRHDIGREKFLEAHPNWAERVILVQIATPPKKDTARYKYDDGEQIKSWISDKSIKEKNGLIEARKKIEAEIDPLVRRLFPGRPPPEA